MNKIIAMAIIVALVGVVVVSSNTFVQAHSQPVVRPMAAFIVDLRNPLPAAITMKVGQNLIIENGAVQVIVKDTDGKGELLTARPHSKSNRIAAFIAKRAGTGELTIIYSVQVPGHKPQKAVTIEVTVSKLIPLPAVISMGKPLPAFTAVGPLARTAQQSASPKAAVHVLDLAKLPSRLTVKAGDTIRFKPSPKHKFISWKLEASGQILLKEALIQIFPPRLLSVNPGRGKLKVVYGSHGLRITNEIELIVLP